MLRKIYFSVFLLITTFTSTPLFAQTTPPDGVIFQAVATDPQGKPAAGRTIYIKDAILQTSATGSVVYSETFQVTASSTGVFTIVIGKGQRLSGPNSISSLDWSAGPYFLNLKAAVAPTIPLANWKEDQQYVDMGTSQFWSVPFALYASKVAGFDLKMNIADTTNMLKAYLRKSDTATLSTRIDANKIAIIQEAARALAVEALKENAANKSISITTDASSDIKYPSVKSVKTYVDAQMFSGPQGLQGPIGLTGATGPQGIQGLTGTTGAQGLVGLIGVTGQQGPIGLTGATGTQGSNGTNGAQGLQGTIGLTGPTGAQGIIGVTGVTGATGTQGIQGLVGVTGSVGATGTTGAQGIQGLIGATGTVGATGTTGVQGIQGPIGATGSVGANGANGAAGSNATISIGDIGTSNTKGATILSGVFSLTPADITNGGIITNGTQTLAGIKTFVAAPILLSTTASLALFTDANRQVVSNAITGTGNVVMSASPTLTGTITAANQTLSGTLGIGTSIPAATAKLEVNSTTQGFLPPRMSYVQRNAIANPEIGLVVFCLDCGIQSVGGELQVFSGGQWRNMMGGAAAATIPSLGITTTATNITRSAANSGGNVTSDGGSIIIARGVVWSTSPNPTVGVNPGTVDAGTTGIYSSSLSGLLLSTTYYIRAFATNAVGTAYGEQINFTTPAVSVPILEATTAISKITISSATSGGNVTDDGGSNITSRGICWSTNPNPTINNYKTIDAGTIGIYTSSITGLIENTNYYARSYATNALGTAYGTQINFTAIPGIGDSFQGGMIFYIFQPGDIGYVASETHGLIAASVDQGKVQWYNNTYTTTGVIGTAIGTGLVNTNAIIASQGTPTTSYAAALAKAYTGGGYSDWYLPSIDELDKMYQNIGQGAAAPLTNIGGFVNDLYWSSAEYELYTRRAWALFFQIGQEKNYYDKGWSNYVRAIRTF